MTENPSKVLRMFLAASAIAAALSLTGCGAVPSIIDPTGSISISPQMTSLPVNGTQVLTANVRGTEGGTPQWSIPNNSGENSLGTLNGTSGATVTYTAPATPPVYGGGQGEPAPYGQSDSSVQGQVTINVAVGLGPSVTTSQSTFFITAPTVTTGIAPTAANLALGLTVEFYGYAVGNVNNGITWQVNGVTGGTTATGTIVNTGYYPSGGGPYVWPGTYTAPAAMPMSGNTITITAVSQADPTKSSSAVVTLM